MEIRFPQQIDHDRHGFAYLAWLNAQIRSCVLDTVIIDMENTSWFSANMCAPLGALLHKAANKRNAIKIVRIQPEVEQALSRNGFLSAYGRWKTPDRYGTTIAYQRFNQAERQLFAQYVDGFIQHQGIPKMSNRFLRIIRQNVQEIFGNSELHSRSALGVFSCGQFFRTKEKLAFAIADLGVGIQQNVKECLRREITPEQAIDWAVQDNHTTRRDRVPGGMGLTVLQQFIDSNRGRIQIVSDAGYWQRANGSNVTASLGNPFPGTIVSIEINTADPKVYDLVA